MKLRKISALLAVTVGVTACGNTTDDASSNQASTSETPEVNLAVWNEPPQDDELNMYKKCEEATGIKINVTVIPESDYSSKLNQMIATNDDSIDIYVVWENDLANFAEVGGIIPLDDYLADSTINTDDFIDAVDTLSSGLGATYGLPWCAATEVLYYNQDMFDEAGLEYPDDDWTYDEYLDAAAKLTVKDGDNTLVYGTAAPNTQTWWAGFGIEGDQVYDPATGEMVIGDGAVNFVTDCADMVSEGIMPEPSSDTTDLFAAGKAAMSWQGSWSIGTYGSELPFNWDVATIPTNGEEYNTLHTGFYTINSNSKNKDAAFEVIEYLLGEEGQTINSKATANPSAIQYIADEGAWKVDSATTIDNWDAMLDSLETGVFGYTCLPSGVTNNAVSLFNSALLGQITPQEAVEQANAYASETMGY